MAYPIYHDDDHLYTVCRDGQGYAIEMIPVLSGPSHIIVADAMGTAQDALAQLRLLAGQAQLKAVKRPHRRSNIERGQNQTIQQ